MLERDKLFSNSIMSASLKTSVVDLLLPILDGEGIELVDVEYDNQMKDETLRLLIDKLEGITIKDCQHVSEIAGPVLEMHGFIWIDIILRLPLRD